MYLIVIAWMYVVLMMSVAEATNTTGSLLGAVITFVVYGLLPVSLVIYLLGAPMRGKAIKRREAEQFRQQQIAAARAQEAVAASAANTPASAEPDAGRHATGGAEAIPAVGDAPGLAPVRKET
ncbi:MAG: hypothetical protein EOO28_28895 [Comamonadaceae bacterium]|nr:MAG: hypothetical protein EOO28_28895 [Comamonadaceae bacterium]